MNPSLHWPSIGAFVAVVCGLWLTAGLLKHHCNVRDGDARKLNHIGTLVGGAIIFIALPADSARWSCRVAAFVLLGLLLLSCRYRHAPVLRLVVEGYARQKDRPHEVFHIWISWLVSIAGLLLVDYLFHDIWVTASSAVILGIADGVAEPIGSRWGHHRLTLMTPLVSLETDRSWEGSFAVFASGTLTAAACLSIIGPTESSAIVMMGIAVGFITMLVEALTPHGWDNLTIPVASSVALAFARSLLI